MEANDMAKIREALKEAVFCLHNCLDPEDCPTEEQIRSIISMGEAALKSSPRNCDVYDAKTAEKEFIRQTGSKSIRSKSVRWLYAPAETPQKE